MPEPAGRYTSCLRPRKGLSFGRPVFEDRDDELPGLLARRFGNTGAAGTAYGAAARLQKGMVGIGETRGARRIAHVIDKQEGF